MADPFEVRMRFTNQLRQLNASVTSAQKAAQYALKHHEMGEDLHSCILEQLEKNNMNTRANIMYFIEHFLDLAHKESQPQYISLMQRDIIRVVDAVAPEDGTGIANVKVARKVLQALSVKNFLERELAGQIEEVLKERYSAAQDLALMSSPSNGNGDEDNGNVPTPKSRVGSGGAGAGGGAGSGGTGGKKIKLDRKQVEQRIEEDRERHKRQREVIWAVSPENESELNKLWEETSELGEDDKRMCEEEWEEWEAAMGAGCGHLEGEVVNGKHDEGGGKV
ncbi:CTD kinase subunit gamma CTK3-domain-containing protein [Cercophora samala]|uniref:CTD kinase subunit gamma CTK3-domain-containing protein n=1 Tax=Cercophora samala TaxID=330535 RepID=A0AA39ZF31_9PEZI|nr:CTD kinase subunit gamma CTK3-domain-containing protein [Cercophora samala]